MRPIGIDSNVQTEATQDRKRDTDLLLHLAINASFLSNERSRCPAVPGRECLIRPLTNVLGSATWLTIHADLDSATNRVTDCPNGGLVFVRQ
jgi:hypothetical protein